MEIKMKLKAPKGCGGVSWDGRNYKVVDGVVEVPDEAAAEFTQPGWGFTPAPVDGETSAPRKTENGKRKTGL
jgi:hypothetical protein